MISLGTGTFERGKKEFVNTQKIKTTLHKNLQTNIPLKIVSISQNT